MVLLPVMLSSKVFCVLEAVSEEAKIAFQLTHNRRFLCHDVLQVSTEEIAADGNRSVTEEVVERWKLVLPIEPRLYRSLTDGVVLGSDHNTCDILLATDESQGVRGSHFSLGWDWTANDPAHLLVKNHCEDGTGLYTVYWETVQDEEHVDPGHWNLVRVGPVTMGLSIALDRDPEDYEEFAANWRQLKSCLLHCRHHD